MDKPFFYILIRSWKTFDYFENCINSVFNQRYKNYKILYIDDASGYSNKQKKRIQVKLNKHIVIFNRIRKYSVYNGFYMIYNYAKKRNSICLILDGDDWLLDKNTLLYISKLYETTCGGRSHRGTPQSATRHPPRRLGLQGVDSYRE